MHMKADVMELPPEDIFGNAKKLKFILEQIEVYREKSGRNPVVLDFGCGNGTGVAAYVIPKVQRYVGVDIHEPSLAYAQENFGAAHASFGKSVPSDVTFDIMIFADLLEHVHDPLGVLTQNLPQLRGDGIVIGSVPNGYGPCEIEKKIDRRLHLYQMLRAVKRGVLALLGKHRQAPAAIPYNHESGHVIFFTMRSLSRMIEAAGLKMVTFRHAGFVGADLTGNVITSRRFVNWNVRVSDCLPSWMVSAWFFVLARDQ
jgi:SAM-dependent methyltransferase